MALGRQVFLGFTLPFSVAYDFGKTTPYDAHPSPALCSKCGRWATETYAYGLMERICRADLGDTVKVCTWRVTPLRRTVTEQPAEKVAEKDYQLVPIPDLYERSFQ